MPQLLTDWSYASLIRLRNADYEAVLGCNKSKPKPKPKPKPKATVGLFDLPAEVRNQIYGYLVSPNLPDVCRGASPVGSIAASTEWDINIMFVNQQAYREASYVFYRDHLFVRVQIVTSGGVLGSIRTLRFDKLIRTGAQHCPRINITLDVFTPRQNDGFLDMVFAYQDIGKIGSLLLHTAWEDSWPFYYNLKLDLEVRLTICEPLLARPSSFNDRFLRPLHGIPGVRFAPADYHALREFLGISEESSRLRYKGYAAYRGRLINFLEYHQLTVLDAETFTKLRTLSLDVGPVDDLARTHLALAEIFEIHGRLMQAHDILVTAVPLFLLLISAGCSLSEPFAPKDIILLRRGIELFAYEFSLQARNGLRDSDRYHLPLELFRVYYHALGLACDSKRVVPLYMTIEKLLLYACQCGEVDVDGSPHGGYWTYFGDEIVEVVSWDPNNELGLDLFHLIHEYRKWPHTSIDHVWAEESIGFPFDKMVQKLLTFSELAKLFTRLYQITGLDQITA
ncbi:MAG: hypothetical protein Q9207_004921 [Kuettlingeria erythrocarpa]